MKKSWTPFFLILSMIFFIACSEDCTECTNQDTDPVPVTEIDGTWRFADGTVDSINIHNKTIYFSNIVNNGTEYIESQQLFNITGTKIIQPNDLLVKKLYVIEEKLFTKSLTEETTNNWNANGYCGFVDWKTNELKNVDGCFQYFSGWPYRIYYLNDNNITWGGAENIYPDALGPFPVAVWIRQ